MLCQECKKNPATVHMTKIINNKKTELHLCENCAGEREDLNWLAPFSINDLLTSFLAPMKPSPSQDKSKHLKCQRCGMDYTEFKKTGRLGCQNCYKSFGDELVPMIKRLQGGSLSHTGKIPHSQGAKLKANRKIADLKRQLEKAVKTEAYEEAAKLRDRIRDLEGKGKGEA